MIRLIDESCTGPRTVVPSCCPTTTPSALVDMDDELPDDDSSPSCITPESVIQLEALVTEAAQEVERCDAADQAATDAMARLEADLQQAEDIQRAVASDRLGAYWTLGQAIQHLEIALAANKGKHSEDTPRARAIQLAGNNSRYQRAKMIASYFPSRAEAEEAAKWQSLNEILEEIAATKAEDRANKGHKAPGRKPTVPKVPRKVTPDVPEADSQKDKGAGTAEDETEVAPSASTEEETETFQSPITQDEIEAVTTFVTAVGGWTRAVYLIKEGYQKWQENR